MRLACDEFISYLQNILTVIGDYEWLVDKFDKNGTYKDVPGLCRIATVEEIAEKNYSLTPGAYVGVAEVEDDGVDFHQRMEEIHSESARLNVEANALMNDIMKSWEEIK